MGVSILQGLGEPELITANAGAYIDKACSLAADVDGLARFRAEIRNRICQSPWGEPDRFNRQLEQVYRTLWKRTCGVSS